MNKKKIPEMHRINASILVAYTFITVILFFAYMLEFVKGSRTPGYTLVFSLFDIVPYVMFCILYRKDKTSPALKYILSIGFSVLYAFVLLTAAVPTTFVYIFMLFGLIVLYGDMKLCFISGGIAIVANAISISLGFANGSLTSADLAMVEIQVASVVLAAVFAGLATNVTGKVNRQKLEEIEEEKSKTETLLTNTLALSKTISDDIDSVTERIEQLRLSVVTTKDSMQDVSSGANETAEALQQQLSQTEEIMAQIEKAKEVTTAITGDVQQTENIIGVGKENIDSLLASVTQSESVSATVASKMDELIENTKQMHSIVEIINSITSKTSMLSLNASIEAARAGEMGKGFAVVASEISTLAGQTNDATVNITKLITDITASIEEAYNSINQLMESNNAQNMAAETMAETFTQIESCVSNIEEVTSDLGLVVSELVKANECMVTNINNVSAVTEEVSARANETLSGSENDAIVVDEVAKVIVEINESAKKLNA